MTQPLPPIPRRVARLPVDPRGFPVPWFVAVLPGGERDFRVADERKKVLAVRNNLCWVCGDSLGVHRAFVIGPMCVVNRVTSEPPCHRDCAEFSATACPFLSRPRMRRNEKNMPDCAVDAPGVAIARNPGSTAVYVTRSYRLFGVAGGGWLIRLGEPEEVLWFAEGRRATREEVSRSIETGYPILLSMAEREGARAIDELIRSRDRAMALLPA